MPESFLSALPKSLHSYISILILLQRVDSGKEITLHVGYHFVDIEVDWLGLIFLMIEGVIADATRTERHKAIS